MNPAEGIALLCDLRGNLIEILRDPFGSGATQLTGRPFARLAARGNLDKALSFMAEINTLGSAFDWEINVTCGEQIKTIHFTGGKVDDHLLIVGAENGKCALQLYEEIILINNEQTNVLRGVYEENARDDNLYDEISRLNNELVSMQRELSKKNAELEDLNQEKNRFLGMAAHDLRNPLHAIMSHSEFLLSKDPAALGLDYHEFLETIYTSSEFMSRLVDDLLDVAKIESGQLQLDYSPVDLAALVTKNAAINQILASRKQITITLSLATISTVVVDRAKLEQVLNNLIGNAVKFSKPGDSIDVRLRSDDANFVLDVQDYGSGMSASDISQLFTPFQRGRTGSGGERSTGLGLVIVKRIVEEHGGTIRVESQVGRGSTFSVCIPFQPTGQKLLPVSADTDHPAQEHES